MNYLIAGNWKMNGLKASIKEISSLKEKVGDGVNNAEVLICPPATLIDRLVQEAAGSAVKIGAQDCHTTNAGAHTGDVSAEMVADLSATHVIVGHSERRTDHGETSEIVKQKAEQVLTNGLVPIICLGETKEEREAGKALDVVRQQANESFPETGEFVVAYEPVWAIGTGLVPTLEDIAEIHDALRDLTSPTTKLLYGGSVKPSNANEILDIENVNGALVGGASLKADDFWGIISAVK